MTDLNVTDVREAPASSDSILETIKALILKLDKAQLDELYDYVDEALWDRQFETIPEGLRQMERDAMTAYEAGLTKPLDLDRF